MSASGYVGWSTQQLSEFAAVVAPIDREDELWRVAAERAAEAFDAEICYLLAGDTVLASFGIGRDRSVIGAIEARRTAGRTGVDVPGIGPCRIAHAELDDPDDRQDGRARGRFVVCRAGDAPFEAEEHALLRGMARLVALSTRSVRLVASLRDRHRLLEGLSAIQRSISTRVPLHQVLDQVLDTACDLLAADRATLWEIDRADERRVRVVRTCGWPVPRIGAFGNRVGSVAGRCIDAALAAPAVTATIADARSGTLTVSVQENGVAVAALVVSAGAGRVFTTSEVDTLVTLGEHAGLAMNDAHTVNAMFEAFHDHVTGLPNRALFHDRIEDAASSGSLDGRDVAVLFIDLDGFKQVNDSLGHEAGDQLLCEVGARLRASLRASDLVARFGGDEFAVFLVRDPGGDHPRLVAERLLDSLRRPVEIAGVEVPVRASVGVALGTGADNVVDLVRDADIAMYRAKVGGKDRCVVFEHAMRHEVVAHRELERDLRRALDGGDLTLAFQPIVALGDLRATGVEALARWEHTERGPIGPRQFVAMAEEMNVVDAIDRFALESACRELRRRIDHGEVPPRFDVFVNLSRGRLHDDAIVTDVRRALDVSGIDPPRLIVEVGESAIADDPDATGRRLWRLHEMGVRIAIDNFGSGLSSLAVLPGLPIDILKIDAQHVAATARRGRRGAVATAIVELARSFGMTTVGEGIESQEHLDALRRIGCAAGQGYLFGRPMAEGAWAFAAAADASVSGSNARSR